MLPGYFRHVVNLWKGCTPAFNAVATLAHLDFLGASFGVPLSLRRLGRRAPGAQREYRSGGHADGQRNAFHGKLDKLGFWR